MSHTCIVYHIHMSHTCIPSAEKYRSGAAFELASQGSFDRFMSWDFGMSSVMFGESTSPIAVSFQFVCLFTGIFSLIQTTHRSETL